MGCGTNFVGAPKMRMKWLCVGVERGGRGGQEAAPSSSPCCPSKGQLQWCSCGAATARAGSQTLCNARPHSPTGHPGLFGGDEGGKDWISEGSEKRGRNEQATSFKRWRGSLPFACYFVVQATPLFQPVTLASMHAYNLHRRQSAHPPGAANFSAATALSLAMPWTDG